ncbi:diguanylate cyclase [Sulfurovum sp. NBC37-1]|uniref:diguanylate cyclase n=1 Tax=Sulfurovum sp. (strain NBC37-1) TaxID=387093 RepID=UPI000158751D|nr:diguanylate cyclase [Sulfurovum sp. NBC37-1]BAF71796.1 conserved hypothetical protein [Sulfurovum sp. NBC37-1]
MKNIQIILNAILSQDVFEYILINRKYHITDFSEGVESYIGKNVQRGDEIYDYLPEIVGYEDRVASVFEDANNRYILETVYKNDHYINIHLEHYSHDIVLILLHNTTEITLSKLELLQYSNENILLYNTIKKILDSQNNLLVVTSNNRIEYANKQFLEYFSIRDLYHLKEREAYNFALTSLPVESFEELYEYAKEKERTLMVGKDTFLVKATPLEKAYKLFTFSKVTQLNEVNQTLKNKIDHDPLTGLYRKSFFDIKLHEKLDERKEAVLAIIDIDDFKKINDNYGHLVGDMVLLEFTDLIRKNMRANDLFARWGGEEFLILFECTDTGKIVKKIEQIRQIIEKHPFKTIGHLTASFGLSTSLKNDTLESLLERADSALYIAKKTGKNKLVVK